MAVRHREDARVAQQGFDDEPAGSEISRQPEQADVDVALSWGQHLSVNRSVLQVPVDARLVALAALTTNPSRTHRGRGFPYRARRPGGARATTGATRRRIAAWTRAHPDCPHTHRARHGYSTNTLTSTEVQLARWARQPDEPHQGKEPHR
jgi:hypothetical protein